MPPALQVEPSLERTKKQPRRQQERPMRKPSGNLCFFPPRLFCLAHCAQRRFRPAVFPYQCRNLQCRLACNRVVGAKDNPVARDFSCLYSSVTLSETEYWANHFEAKKCLQVSAAGWRPRATQPHLASVNR